MCLMGPGGSDVRRALVVEDDEDIRDLLVDTLTPQGFEVSRAESGRQGIETARSESPDLVTLDLGLPDLDGVEVCRRLREFSDAYIVMITARQDEIDRLIGLETGADDYLSKPFSPRELKARVNAMFRRPRSQTQQNGAQAQAVPAQATTASGGSDSALEEIAHAWGEGPPPDDHEVLRHGPLVVDVDGRGVLLDGEELTLTRTEFDLLVTLLRAPKRVWTREVLLRSVWGNEWASDYHLVEVHVGNLRRKLGDSGRESRFVRTVRGVGYRMEPPEPTR